ncbi:GWxTD domain-containing protein [Flectobacillus major]|jgi:GWxTD domain-containing protein|uniref:GWxTD domain-containing protein n=1 Tax=Flectobacillus major TaxID=103 RepID=UPI00040FC928|nr:GWxTD domain-containing protein [Flectobacillus major]
MKKLIYLLSSLYLLWACAPTSPTAKKNSGQNLENRVPLQRIATKSKFLDNGNTVRVYVNLHLDRTTSQSDALKELVISYNLLSDYNNKQPIASSTVALTTENFLNDSGWFTVWFDIPKPKDLLTAVVMTDIRDNRTNNKVTNDCFVRFQSGKVSDYFMFFDKTGKLPILKSFFSVTDTVILRSLDNKNQNFKAFRYKYEFDPALSPMATSQRVPQKSLYVDSAFSIKSNTLVHLNTEALYYFTRDTTESFGIGTMVVDKRFPKFTRPEKLVRPLIYMSTSSETADLYGSREAKKALDNYWLNIMQGNQNNAKRTIKAFFQRVEQANRMFTSYKEGWKTDKGMVWIIMGDPTRITRTKDKEVWTYTRNSQYSEVNFTFNKRANQFVEDHYELQRYAEYQSIWFPTVEQWRNGDIVVK